MITGVESIFMYCRVILRKGNGLEWILRWFTGMRETESSASLDEIPEGWRQKGKTSPF